MSEKLQILEALSKLGDDALVGFIVYTVFSSLSPALTTAIVCFTAVKILRMNQNA